MHAVTQTNCVRIVVYFVVYAFILLVQGAHLSNTKRSGCMSLAGNECAATADGDDEAASAMRTLTSGHVGGRLLMMALELLRGRRQQQEMPVC